MCSVEAPPPRKESCAKCAHTRCNSGKMMGRSKFLPLLAVLSIFSNVYFVANHQKALLTRSRRTESLPFVDSTMLKSAKEILSLERQAKQKMQLESRKGKGGAPAMIAPPQASLSPDATFSACLLIKDDNEILAEWIAYHYHTLNLRRLIIAVDPDTSESPWNILQRWKLMTDLEIVQWTDNQFMPDHFLKHGHPPEEYLQKQSDFEGMGETELMQISSHRYRQRVFLAKCLKKQKELGSTWTMHIDTDEYVVPAKLFRQARPDHVEQQPMDEPGSVLYLLQQTALQTPALVNYPCISMLRLLFGSVESSDKASNNIEVPESFNATSFESLRWRHHAPPHNMSYHGNPKVIVDVSAIPASEFPTSVVFSIHRPITSYCKKNKELLYDDVYMQPVATNHYLGSYERYSARSDHRRSRQVYDQKARVDFGTDHGTQLWLQGFVNALGSVDASKLLGKQHLNQLVELAPPLVVVATSTKQAVSAWSVAKVLHSFIS